MKFRKKPIIIEAFQMTHERRWDNSEWPDWLNKAWNTESEEDLDYWPPKADSVYCVDGGEPLFISTLEGIHKVTWDDWIIQGISGELYPCKPDIFENTYEPVE